MIPRSSIVEYTQGINQISAQAKARLVDALASIDYTAAGWVDAVLEAMQLVCGASTDVASVLAANFYDYVREAELGAALGAYADSGRNPIATEKAVRGIVQKGVDGNISAMQNELLARVDYEIKRAAADTAFRNGTRDKANVRFARVPTGTETCQFCLMLASRGFVYRSRETAIDHYHANCDCRVVPGFDGTAVEGYDPDAIYREWQDSIDAEAKERAERNGTSDEHERDAIMARYRRAASSAKNRNK